MFFNRLCTTFTAYIAKNEYSFPKLVFLIVTPTASQSETSRAILNKLYQTSAKEHVVEQKELMKNYDNSYQTDMIILDFSKAFDTVPHRRLLQ
jgi:hypothetical protein